jgi:hypothetical protein
MSRTKQKLLLLFLFPLGLLFNQLFNAFPHIGERYYSRGINKYFIMTISRIWGIFSFSIFEILIYIGVTLLLIYLVTTILNIFKNTRVWLETLGHFFLNLACIGAIIYILFMLFWGLNYRRPSFASSYGIEPGTYSTKELGDLYEYLVKQANKAREHLPEDENGVMIAYGDIWDIFLRAQVGYDLAAETFDKLGGTYGSPKPILASPLLNYTGITGMYAPFTGEPNVNVAILDMDLPATTTHEMAHQRGYGFENECNFIAYLVCTMHPDADFRYSGYVLAIAYTSNALATVDFERLQQVNSKMSEKVYNDLTYHNTFWNQYKGDLQEVSDKINNTYLIANGVSSGTDSYGEVVDLILSYYMNHQR